jgi:phage baseplate assembly protein W
MATLINQKYPLDLEARKAIGYGFPLNGNAVFKPTYQTRDQIKANLINYLLTNKKERVFNPNFGADLRSLLFENIIENNLENLQDIIQSDINNFFPMVNVREIKFERLEDNNTINFSLTYDIASFDIEDTLDIILQ